MFIIKKFISLILILLLLSTNIAFAYDGELIQLELLPDSKYYFDEINKGYIQLGYLSYFYVPRVLHPDWDYALYSTNTRITNGTISYSSENFRLTHITEDKIDFKGETIPAGNLVLYLTAVDDITYYYNLGNISIHDFDGEFFIEHEFLTLENGDKEYIIYINNEKFFSNIYTSDYIFTIGYISGGSYTTRNYMNNSITVPFVASKRPVSEWITVAFGPNATDVTEGSTITNTDTSDIVKLSMAYQIESDNVDNVRVRQNGGILGSAYIYNSSHNQIDTNVVNGSIDLTVQLESGYNSITFLVYDDRYPTSEGLEFTFIIYNPIGVVDEDGDGIDDRTGNPIYIPPPTEFPTDVGGLIDSIGNVINLIGDFPNIIRTIFGFFPYEITALIMFGITLGIMLRVLGR